MYICYWTFGKVHITPLQLQSVNVYLVIAFSSLLRGGKGSHSVTLLTYFRQMFKQFYKDLSQLFKYATNYYLFSMKLLNTSRVANFQMLLLYFISLLSLIGYNKLKQKLAYFLSYNYKKRSFWILSNVIFKCVLNLSVEYERTLLFVNYSAAL